MKKDVVRYAVAIPIGVAIALFDRVWLGVMLTAFGAFMLAIEWRFRHALPFDPEFDKQLDAALKLEKTNPAAAHALMDKMMAEEEGRREAELADLRARAATDRTAAKQLRSRLLGKLDNTKGGRRLIKRSSGDKPHGAKILEEIAREESGIERELAALEDYLRLTKGM